MNNRKGLPKYTRAMALFSAIGFLLILISRSRIFSESTVSWLLNLGGVFLIFGLLSGLFGSIVIRVGPA